GVLRALMAPGWVTGVRTAALSAVAAARMADPASRVIAFVGTGVQARSHLDAMAALFPLAEMRAVGRGPANLDRLCDKARAMGLAATVCETPRDALEGADIVVTSVTLNFDLAPFLDARWLKPGAFAAITDLALPWVPEGMPALAPVVIDSLVQEAASARKMVDPALVAGDLATLVAGRLALPAARTRPSAFVFRGVAIGDFAVAALAYRRAVEASAGVPLPGW
ncbi:MAG: ornithine cyclodeaminase family protein, partial [Pseudomonadota bacterium]